MTESVKDDGSDTMENVDMRYDFLVMFWFYEISPKAPTYLSSNQKFSAKIQRKKTAQRNSANNVVIV